jgi:GNAT superfamily N-acetyltransferase
MKKRLPRLPDDVLPKLAVPVRRLAEADRPAVLAYYRALPLAERAALFGHPLSDEGVARYVNRLNFSTEGHYAALGAASVIIGVAHCLLFDGQGLVSIHVAQGYRRRGIGAALTSHLASFGRANSLAWLRAYFSKNDPIAMRLARTVGMELVFGIDRFHAQLSLLPARVGTRPGIQSGDARSAESAAPAATA